MPRPRPGQGKSIYDPIHGTIPLDPVALELVGTAAFQRLWGIRQTGFAHLVFPGANHTRLEHSLGVFWIARRFSSALSLDPDESTPLVIGGLLHDLGHPPFSHTLDPSMVESLGVGHEAISRNWILGRETYPGEPTSIPEILERHGIGPNEVADRVDPGGRSARDITDLLHGAVDADRIDYLQRDAHYTGVAHGVIDAVRILETVRSRGNRICFAEKGRSALEGFLLGRALMYSSVYYHKTVRAAEVMAQSALERLPGYPHETRELFGVNDGQFLERVAAGSARSRQLVDALLKRQLFKRVGGIMDASGDVRRRLLSLDTHPVDRRAAEDRIAARLGVPEGAVLLDLAGARVDREAEREWAEVALVENGRLSFPFRGTGPWQTLLRRPPTRFGAALYVHPRFRQRVRSRLARATEMLRG